MECCNRPGPHVHAVKPKDTPQPIIVDDLPEEPAEIPVEDQISEDEVIERPTIAFKLVGAFRFIKRFAHIFGFNVADS